jgi:hypothetical protein
MIRERTYVKDRKGYVHLLSPTVGGDTLCGDACDLDLDVENGDFGAESTPVMWYAHVKRGPVTCPFCIRIIEQCRNVRTRNK